MILRSIFVTLICLTLATTTFAQTQTAKVSGTFLDVTTGKKPQSRPTLQNAIAAISDAATLSHFDQPSANIAFEYTDATMQNARWSDFDLQLPVGWNYLFITSNTHWLLASKLDDKTAEHFGVGNIRAKRIFVPREGISNLVLRVAPETKNLPQAQQVRRQILLPDGTPAARADVYLSYNDEPRESIHPFQTDETGWLELKLRPLQSDDRKSAILIDAKGAAPYQETLRNFITDSSATSNGLVLPEPVTIFGRVADREDKAVEGGTVMQVGPFSERLSTPTLIAGGAAPRSLWTLTKADGSWSLTIPLQESPTAYSVRLLAAAGIHGRLWTGTTEYNRETYNSEIPSRTPPKRFGASTPLHKQRVKSVQSDQRIPKKKPSPMKVWDITLWPTFTLRGRVLYDSGAPVKEAIVDVYQRKKSFTWERAFAPFPDAAFTAADGRFEIEGIPMLSLGAVSNWSINAFKNQNGTRVSWLGLQPKYNLNDSWEVWRKWNNAGEIELRLPDIVNISGKVVPVDGEPPFTGNRRVTAWRGTYLKNGLMRADQYFVGGEILAPQLSHANVDSEGRFKLRAPSGSNTFTLSGDNISDQQIGYESTRGDQSNIILRAQRDPAQ